MSRRALSDTAYGSLAVYIEYLFGLIASILTARALLPGDMGVYSLLVWLVANAVVIANAGITLGAIKFIAELRGAGREADTARLVHRLRGMQRTMLAIVAAVLALVFVLFRDRLGPARACRAGCSRCCWARWRCARRTCSTSPYSRAGRISARPR